MPGLAATLLEAHGLAPVPLGHADERALPRVDQVLLDADAAALVSAALERAGAGRAAVRPAIADAGGSVDSGAAHDWRPAARARGLRLPRPGHGDTVALQRERLAAPGAIVACAGPLAACGALGMLALPAEPLAIAALLAGAPLVLRAPRVRAVALEGALPAGVDGVDLGLALLAQAAGCDVLELAGPGVGGLAVADRCATAWLLAQAGVAALFPSDGRTRAALAAWGRDEDWRRVEAAEAEPDARLDLGALAPGVAPAGAPAAAGPIVPGETIERVLVGPGATFDDLARLAAALGSAVPARAECTVQPGSLALAERLTTSGLAGRLAAVGVRIVGEPPPAAAGGTGLCHGVALASLAGARARWLVAGIGTCAAAAVAGALGATAARWAAPGEEDGTPGPRPEPWLEDEDEAAPAAGRPRRAAPRAWRGEVLAALGDDADTPALLPRGPRLERLRGRLHAQAGQLLAGLDAGFAERARARRGGVVVAGERFGGGTGQDLVAACLAEIGVWAVLARSYAPGAGAALARAGVLPLARTAGAAPPAGAVLELPGLPAALVPGRSLAARDLTRGRTLTLHHDCSAREVAMLRAGGLLALAGAGAGG